MVSSFPSAKGHDLQPGSKAQVESQVEHEGTKRAQHLKEHIKLLVTRADDGFTQA